MIKHTEKSVPGIYEIKNHTNGKVYIGQSHNVKHRIAQHLSALRSGKHSIPEMQRDWLLGHVFTGRTIAAFPSVVNSEYLRRLLNTYEFEHITDNMPDMLYNIDKEPKLYLWNTVMDIPESIRKVQLYHKGDIHNPDLINYIITEPEIYKHSLAYKHQQECLFELLETIDYTRTKELLAILFSFEEYKRDLVSDKLMCIIEALIG